MTLNSLSDPSVSLIRDKKVESSEDSRNIHRKVILKISYFTSKFDNESRSWILVNR